jgi:hypothetical protein
MDLLNSLFSFGVEWKDRISDFLLPIAKVPYKGFGVLGSLTPFYAKQNKYLPLLSSKSLVFSIMTKFKICKVNESENNFLLLWLTVNLFQVFVLWPLGTNTFRHCTPWGINIEECKMEICSEDRSSQVTRWTGINDAW